MTLHSGSTRSNANMESGFSKKFETKDADENERLSTDDARSVIITVLLRRKKACLELCVVLCLRFCC